MSEDAVYNFVKSMIEESKCCTDIMKKHFSKELEMTKEEDEDLENPGKCWICDNVYVDGDVKVRDHYHITGKYRDSPHRDFNIKVKLNHRITIVFHNLKNYDSHLTMQEIGKFDFKIKVIPNVLEKYMSINISNKLIFIDSFQFLSSSLDSLVNNLGKNDFKYMSQKFDSKVLDLVKQKGFYPYAYMSDFETFKEKLPSKEKFYPLTSEKITDKECEHVLKVRNKFEMKMMKDYHDLYLKCDVLLLAVISEKFRNSSLKNYGLYSSHYLSAAALSWDAILNMTKVDIELISNTDMYLFFEKGMRDGVSYISKRCSIANNKYLNSYDPKQKQKHIICLYANNLYGYVMPKFELIGPKYFDSNKYSSNSLAGCVLEADLEYP